MHMRLSALGVAVFLASVGAVARAAPEIDILASAGLGDELGGRPIAVDLFDDGTVVLAGEDEHGSTLVRLDGAGISMGKSKRIAGVVHDVAVDRREGQIAVVGDTELVVFGPDLAISWQAALPAVHEGEHRRRVDVGELGTVAVVAAGQLRTFSADGHVLGRAVLLDSTTSSLAVLDAADLVVTTGWNARSACGDQLDVAALSGFGRDGSERWRAYGDIEEPVLCDDSASTRGIDVARGEDGLLYLLAEVEGSDNIFGERPGVPMANVAFDAMTSCDDVASSQFAYYARFSPTGEHMLGQYFAFPDEDALVQPSGIAADEHGNVVITGTTSHSLEADDDPVVHAEALYAPAGFYQLVRADFRARDLWRSLEIDGMTTVSSALALAGPRVVTLLHATRLANAPDSGSPAGPMVLVWPTDPESAIPKRPDRDDVGTFGYESGVAGSDPTCYACGPTRQPTPIGVLALASVIMLCRPRSRGRR